MNKELNKGILNLVIGIDGKKKDNSMKSSFDCAKCVFNKKEVIIRLICVDYVRRVLEEEYFTIIRLC